MFQHQFEAFKPLEHIERVNNNPVTGQVHPRLRLVRVKKSDLFFWGRPKVRPVLFFCPYSLFTAGHLRLACDL